MLRIEMLPVGHGDGLWIEYGNSDDIHRILIDGGPAHTYEALRWRIMNLPKNERHFELLVITHVDADHIEGIIRLLQDDDCACTFGDIWYNDWKQIENIPGLPPLKTHLGPMQGEFLGALIEQRVNQSWNSPWQGEAIFIPPSSNEPLQVIDNIPGGLKLTILSPELDSLEKLRDKWFEVVQEAGFTPGDRNAALKQLQKSKRLGPPRAILGGLTFPSTPDSSIANASSIALLIEFDKIRILLAGDSHSSTLELALDRWLRENEKDSIKLDAFKLPHHGSKNNISEKLLDMIRCKHYLISTNGDRFNHPDFRTIECILDKHNARGKPHLHFNYRSEETEYWASSTDHNGKYYVAHCPVGAHLNLY